MGKKEGFLRPIDKGDGPLQTYYIDHLGPMEMTAKKYKHIFTVVDGFSKFVWIYPTKSTTAKEVIDRLQLQQKSFGNPQRMVSDAGSCFTSIDFKEFCQRENIDHHVITTGVPRGNGQVEIIHRTIISALTKLSINNPSQWYRHVDTVQRCLNSAYNRAINRSPFEVLIGVKMRNKEDVEICKIINEEQILTFDDAREDIRKNAKIQIQKIQEENRRTFNRGRKKASKYREGDLVAIKRTQFGPGLKIHPEYLGPYEVKRKLRRDRYQVQKVGIGEGPLKTSTAADLMKPWPSTGYPSETNGSQERPCGNRVIDNASMRQVLEVMSEEEE